MAWMSRYLEHLPIVSALSVALFSIALAGTAFSQREAASRGNYGKVYEATGGSAAAKTVRAKINLTLISAITRPKRPASAVKDAGSRSKGLGNFKIKQMPDIAQASADVFRPDPNLDTSNALAESLGTTAEEKALLRQLFSVTKTAFEKEVAAKGRKNNLAAAFTFFIGSAAMVYHDDPEPSDAALDKLWDNLDATFNETPEYSQLTNREKQEMYDTIVAFSGLILATYAEGKNTGNVETQQTAKLLAGTMIQLVLKTDPNKLRFGKDGLVVNPT